MKQILHLSRKIIIKSFAWLLVAATISAVLLVLVAKLVDTNRFKPQIQTLVEETTGRSFTITGDVALGVGFSPSLTAHNVRFGNAKGATQEDMLKAKKISLSLSLPALFTNKVVIDALKIDDAQLFLEKNTQGKGNWQFSSAKAESTDSITVDINDIIIKNSEIIYIPKLNDKKQIYAIHDIKIHVKDADILAVKGKIAINDVPLEFKGTINRLATLLEGDLTSALTLESGKSEAKLRVKASNLYYSPVVDVVVDAEDMILNELVPVEKAQDVLKKQWSKKEDKLFSDAVLKTKPLDRLVLSAKINIDKLHINKALFKKFDILVKIKNGQITVDHVNTELAKGTLLGNAHYDTKKDPSAFALSLTGEHIDMGMLLAQLQASEQLDGGVLSFLLNVHGKGNSSHAIAASLDGEFSAFVEDAVYNNNLDIGSAEGFFKLLVGKKDSHVMNINCAASIFTIKEGTAKSKAIVVDATGAMVRGKGKIKLGAEEFALRFYPKAKLVGLADLATPMRLDGTFMHPKFYPDPKGVLTTIGKVAVGVATGGAATVGMFALDMAGKLGQAVKKNACTEAISSFVNENKALSAEAEPMDIKAASENSN